MSCDETITEVNTPTILVEASTSATIVSVNDITYIIDASPEVIIEVDNSFQIIESVEQGPPGPQGPPGNIGEFQFSTDVDPQQTEVLDEIDILTIRATKWIVVIEDNVNNLYQYFDFSAIHNGSTTKDTLYARKGDKFDYDIDTVINGSFMQLSYTNNSLTDQVTVKTVRINVNI